MKYYPILLLFCVCCATLSAKKPDTQSRNQQTQALTSIKIGLVCVNKPDNEEPQETNTEGITYWSGSGTVISDRNVLTAAHMTSCSNEGQFAGIYIKLQDDRIIQMRVVKVNKRSDIALLEMVDSGKIGIRVILPSVAAVNRDDIVCASTSYPKRGWICGTVVKVHHDRIDISQNVIHGNSGSPLYNINGELVGIVTTLYTCKNDNDEEYQCGGAAAPIWNHLDMMP